MKVGSFNERRIAHLEMVVFQLLSMIETHLPSTGGMCSSLRSSLMDGSSRIDHDEALAALNGQGDIATIRNLITQNDLVKSGLSHEDSQNFTLNLATEKTFAEGDAHSHGSVFAEIWKTLNPAISRRSADDNYQWRPATDKLPHIGSSLDPETITSGFYKRSISYSNEEVVLVVRVDASMRSVYLINLTDRGIGTYRYAIGEQRWVYIPEFLPEEKKVFDAEYNKILVEAGAWKQLPLERKTFFAMVDPLIEDYFPKKVTEWVKGYDSYVKNRFHEFNNNFHFTAEVGCYKITFYMNREHGTDRFFVEFCNNRKNWEDIPGSVQHQFLRYLMSHLSGEKVEKGLRLQWADAPSSVADNALRVFSKAFEEYTAFSEEQKKPITLELDNETE